MTRPIFSSVLMKLAVLAFFGVVLGPSLTLAAGGNLDPADLPLINALSVQIATIDNQLLKAVGGGTPDPTDLPFLKRLASRLSEVDIHLGIAAVGGGPPDPTEIPLINALLALRSKTETLRGHLEDVIAIAETIPILNQITVTRTLKYMLKTSQMILLRINYSLLHAGLPTPIPDF